MPILHWLTRDEDIQAAKRVPFRILEEVPELSYGDKNAGNMLIQGDNLDALKALLPFFAGRVKCIYIDPPYNTRSAFEHYDDNLEHSTWLSMMWPRLELLATFFPRMARFGSPLTIMRPTTSKSSWTKSSAGKTLSETSCGRRNTPRRTMRYGSATTMTISWSMLERSRPGAPTNFPEAKNPTRHIRTPTTIQGTLETRRLHMCEIRRRTAKSLLPDHPSINRRRDLAQGDAGLGVQP